MGRMWRKQCDGTQCRDPAFKPARSPRGDAAFFRPTLAGPDAPPVQKQEALGAAEEEKKDPLTEGLKTTAGKLAENDSFKKWYEPRLASLKYTLWDKASPAEKAAMASFLGINVGMAGLAFASNPKLRESLSGVNIGKPLGWIPYSPVEGFSYKLPGAGKTATEFSTDFTLNPYLDLWKNRPGFMPSGATFGLESRYDPRQGFNLTGGKLWLDFFGGSLKAQGSISNELSPYPRLDFGREGQPPNWFMQEYPALPMIKGPDYRFVLSADLMELIPDLQNRFRSR